MLKNKPSDAQVAIVARELKALVYVNLGDGFRATVHAKRILAAAGIGKPGAKRKAAK